MYGKIQIRGIVELKTGMHIGGSEAFAAIGAVDSPVIRDIQTGKPMLPGSSVKGKIRTLLAKELNEKITQPDCDHERILRVFGSSKKGDIRPSRILVSDMFLANGEELKSMGIQTYTEVKFENSISRTTGVANPRQIERTVRGSKFDLDIIYEVTNKETENEIIEDFELIAEGLKLLEYDYLGGSGSRGYGKVSFNNLNAKAVVGNINTELVNKCESVLQEVFNKGE